MEDAIKIEIVDYKGVEPANLFSLIQEVYNSTDGFCGSFEEKYKSIEEFKSQLDKAHKGSQSLVAKVGNKLAGYIFLSSRPESKLEHTAEFTMGVSPAFQKRGVGRLLLESMLEKRKPQIEIIYLAVRADNLSAVSLYKQLSFKQIATLENDTKINNQYFDAILMSRSFI